MNAIEHYHRLPIVIKYLINLKFSLEQSSISTPTNLPLPAK
jgi:hypothetical protein